jgi:hypothetical protein
MDSEHKKYDDPEDPEDTRAKAWSYLLGGIVVVVILLLVATGRVPVFSG